MIRLPLAIDPAHPAFEGHFPSMPIVPGAVLLDHGLRALATYRAEKPADGAERCHVGAAKFLSFVRPGESVRLEIESSDATTDAEGRQAFRLRIFAGPADAERLALSGNVAFERVTADAVRRESTG